MRNKGAVLVCVLLSGGLGYAMHFNEWQPAVSVESVPGTDPSFNTTSQDGCPAPSKDGLKIFMASNRAGSQGLDIWVAERESADDPFGAPVNLGPVINTSGDEFCPTPLRNGHGLLFVSTKPGGCGGSDIYLARYDKKDGWQTPAHLGCTVNSAGNEASPILVEYDDGRTELYFSSNRPGGYSTSAPDNDSDIYVSAVLDDGTLGAPQLAEGLNTALEDSRPNLRRDGLEIYFDSNRSGGLGGADIWSAVREHASDAWSLPVNVGDAVNGPGNETRPFLSWGGTTLYFGTTMRTGVEGLGDIWFTTRTKATGSQHQQ